MSKTLVAVAKDLSLCKRKIERLEKINKDLLACIESGVERGIFDKGWVRMANEAISRAEEET